MNEETVKMIEAILLQNGLEANDQAGHAMLSLATELAIKCAEAAAVGGQTASNAVLSVVGLNDE